MKKLKNWKNVKFIKFIYKRNIKKLSLNHNQQQLSFYFFFLFIPETFLVLSTLPYVYYDSYVDSSSPITLALFLISFVIVIKASSTFTDSLAEVSKNLTPKDSA